MDSEGLLKVTSTNNYNNILPIKWSLTASNVDTQVRPEVKINPELDSVSTIIIGLDAINHGERVLISNIGLDVGTKNIVLAYRNEKQKINYLSEVNGYWLFERASQFIENMLSDPNKIRSDGTKRPARFFKLPEQQNLVIIGKDAEEFAYAKNDTLLRPMAEGGIAPDEIAMTVLSVIIHGLLNMAENEFGKFNDSVKICYCTTANTLDKSSNIDYHQRVLNIILGNYNSKSNITYNTIKESHAIVLNMSQDGSGIGISFGAGTVTVSYIKYGMEIYSFALVGSGDWIDTEVAKRHGFDSNNPKRKSPETPTTVSKKKHTIDLSPEAKLSDRLSLDIALFYDVLIEKVINGIVEGFLENESQARIDDGVSIYIAGGTSSPTGFVERVNQNLSKHELPFTVNSVKRSEQPLYCVAEGLLKASENF